MKKIVFLIPTLKHGGAEKVLVNLANHLDRTQYDVTIQTLFDVGVHKKNLLPHVHYKSFMNTDFRGNTILFKMFTPEFWWKQIIKDHYDIAVSYLEGPTARILSGCNDRETKRVAWLHIELNSPQLAAQGFRSIKEAECAYAEFDRIVAVSNSVRESFLKSISVKARIDVIYNTNETETIKGKALARITNPAFHCGDIPTICSVAKLMKTKGFDRLIEAHKRLLSEGFMHRVYILGIGEEHRALKRKIIEYRLENSFFLLGFDENPYRYIAKCDLYVCSSRREGFSTAVTEALILGVPVVSTDCSGARELLGDNSEYGIIVENSTEGIYQGLKKLMMNPDLLSYYKEQSELRGRSFSKEKTVHAVEAMLANL